MLKAMVVMINLFTMPFVIGEEDVYFSREENECVKELNLSKQQILDHLDLNTFEFSENVPHIEDFVKCLLNKLKFDINSENPEYINLENFLEDILHPFEFKIKNKLEFAKIVVKNCHKSQKTEKDNIKFLNCVLKQYHMELA